MKNVICKLAFSKYITLHEKEIIHMMNGKLPYKEEFKTRQRALALHSLRSSSKLIYSFIHTLYHYFIHNPQ